MTELLQQAIAQIEKLPPDRQDAIASRFLAELQDEQKWEARFAATTDTQWERYDFSQSVKNPYLKKLKVQSCFEIADYFIWLANETGSFISNLKLQKLVYYTQAWHLALYQTPLFEEDFQAWIHGPVIPELYQEYKDYRWKPILKDVTPELPSDILEFLDEVAEEYFACDGYELEQMTHTEAPWNQARENLQPDEPSDAIIDKEWMKEYYRSRVEVEEKD